MKLKYLSASALCLVMCSACSTMRDSILLGAGSGAAAGSLVGYAAGGRQTTPTLIGGATGAVTGGLIGLIVHKLSENKSAAASREASSDKDPKLPFLTRPEVRSIWVPDKIEGNQYIEGHRIYIIEKQSSWSKD